MLDDDDVALRAKQAADQAAGGETLFHVQEGRGLVEHVAVAKVSHCEIFISCIGGTYTSAFTTQTMAMAKRCNSPPERRSMSRSQTCLSSVIELAVWSCKVKTNVISYQVLPQSRPVALPQLHSAASSESQPCGWCP